MWMPWHAPPTQTQLPDQEHSFMATALNGSDAPRQQDIVSIAGRCYRLYLDCCSVLEGDSFQVAFTSHVSSTQGFPAEHRCYSFHLLVLHMLQLIHVYQNQVYVQTEGIWIIAPRAQSNWCWMVIHQSHNIHVHHIWHLQLEYCFEPK